MIGGAAVGILTNVGGEGRKSLRIAAGWGDSDVADRGNHYEAAFEAYLRAEGVPYVAVDEARRAVMADGRSLKSLDFIVASTRGFAWLVDIKGRRFPSGDEHHQYWKNWSTRDDLESLAEWERLFGEGFRGLFVFAFERVGPRLPVAPEEIFTFRDRQYGFLAVELGAYRESARLISPRWDTLAVSGGDFRRLARPMRQVLGPPETARVA